MTPGARAKRQALATNKMLEMAEALTERFEIDPEIMARLDNPSGPPDVKQMKIHEAIADLMEEVVKSTAPTKPKRSTSKKSS